MSDLLLKGVSKRYLNGINAVSNFNLELSDGELVVLAGPKGAGKSTILNIICGLEKLDEGEVFIDAQSSIDISAKERGVAIIFPCHELYPNNTVYENLEFSLRLMKCPRSQREDKIMKVAKDMELTEVLEKLPEDLTPAENFAAILARCVIKNPKVILIDEPFPDMPSSEQEMFWQAIINLNKKFKHTMLVATNNPEEALAMKARTVILKNGYIQQVDNVSNIYKNPANIYVAQFINHFNMTTIEGSLSEKGDGALELVIDKGSISIPVNAPDNKKLGNYIGREVTVGIRHCCLKPNKNSDDGVKGKIDEVIIEDGKRLGMFKSKLFDARVYIDDAIREGDKVSLTIGEGSFFVFDRDTGKTIL